MKLLTLIQKYKPITVFMSIGLILTVVDIYTTYILHVRGYIEWNPFMRSILTELGLPPFLLINAVLSVLLIAFLAYASAKKLEEKYRYLPLIVYCVIRGSTVVNNLLIFVKAR